MEGAMGPERETQPARLIVCERTGRWAVALRRELAGQGVRVWEARLWDDLEDELTVSPASLLVVELPNGDALKNLLPAMMRFRQFFPHSRMAVVADRALADCEGYLREAGAVYFTCSPRKMAPLARIACRHLARMPQAQRSLGEQIWASLPWGN